MLYFTSNHTYDKFVKNKPIKKQNGTFRRLSLMCNEVTSRRQTGQRLSWKQSDESKVLHMEQKEKKKCWTDGKSWATVLFLHCDEYEGGNVWCWGEKKGAAACKPHKADESQWMHHSGSGPRNVRKYLQKNGGIITSFSVCAKYWNGFKRLEKLILIK